MTDVAVLWIIGLACLIVALLGKAVTVGSVQLPEAAEKRARFGMAIVGVLALVRQPADCSASGHESWLNASFIATRSEHR